MNIAFCQIIFSVHFNDYIIFLFVWLILWIKFNFITTFYSKINFTCSWCIIVLTYCYIQLSNNVIKLFQEGFGVLCGLLSCNVCLILESGWVWLVKMTWILFPHILYTGRFGVKIIKCWKNSLVKTFGHRDFLTIDWINLTNTYSAYFFFIYLLFCGSRETVSLYKLSK